MSALLRRKPHGTALGFRGTISAALFFGDDGTTTEVAGFMDRETHIVCVQVRPLSATDYWLDGRRILRRAPASTFSAHLIAAGMVPHAICYGSFGVLQIYVPDSLVQRVALSLGAAAPRALQFDDPRFQCDPEIALIARELYYLLERSDTNSRISVDALGIRLAVRLVTRWSNIVDLQHLAARSLTSSQLASLRQAIHREPATPWQAHALAEIVNLASSDFVARLESTVGRPLDAWIENERVDAASASLLQSRLTLKEIAHAHGWATTGAMHKAFEMQRGVRPSLLRGIQLH